MNYQDYIDEVRACAQRFIDNEYQHANDYEQVFDVMLDEDSITGAASGSYTCDRAQAEENIQGVLNDQDVYQRFLDIGWTDFPEEPEDVDVNVRVFALYDLHDELADYFAQMR